VVDQGEGVMRPSPFLLSRQCFRFFSSRYQFILTETALKNWLLPMITPLPLKNLRSATENNILLSMINFLLYCNGMKKDKIKTFSYNVFNKKLSLTISKMFSQWIDVKSEIESKYIYWERVLNSYVRELLLIFSYNL